MQCFYHLTIDLNIYIVIVDLLLVIASVSINFTLKMPTFMFK